MRSDAELMSRVGIACSWQGQGSQHGYAHLIVVIARDRYTETAVEAYLCHACVEALGITVGECEECDYEV